jgi:hypothetical protein
MSFRVAVVVPLSRRAPTASHTARPDAQATVITEHTDVLFAAAGAAALAPAVRVAPPGMRGP